MLSLLAAAAVVKLAYSFPVDVKRVYDVQTTFEGFIPILGGHEGKVEVNLVVSAKGLSPTNQGNPRVLGTLDDIKVVFNEAPLPFVTTDSAKDYFPPTTISLTPFGVTLSTDAPDVKLPVKLPGLDAKRFPDITYLPLQLPEEGAEVGKSYTFKKSFGDSDVVYTVTPRKVDGDSVEMAINLTQKYEVLENEGKEVVKDAKDAVAKVSTTVAGTGVATFDAKQGAFTNVVVDAVADSIVNDLETHKDSARKLKTRLLIRLRK